MGLFDGILGGVVGAEMATVVNGLIEKHGGVQGIVAQLEQVRLERRGPSAQRQDPGDDQQQYGAGPRGDLQAPAVMTRNARPRIQPTETQTD